MDNTMKILAKIYRMYSIVIFISILCYVTHGQDKYKIDSLKTLVANQIDDSNKVNNNMLLAYELSDSNPAKALNYTWQAYNLSKEINYQKGTIKALYEQCWLYKSMGNLDSAIACINEYIAIGDSINDSVRLANGYLRYGNLLRRKGESVIARNLFLNSLHIYNLLDDTSGIISTYNALGISYKNSSDFDSAAYYYFLTLKMCEAANYEWGIGPTLINLGKVYIELKDFENAKKYTEQSIEYSSKSNNIKHIALAYTNLGIIAVEENNNSTALEYYSKAFDLNKQIENIIGMNNLILNIGSIYKSEGNYTKALENFNEAIDAFRKIGYKTGLISALMYSANTYADLGQYKRAFRLYDSCLKITFETGEKHKRKEAYELIYVTHFTAGNYLKAFEYLDKFHKINDSIYNIEKEEIITELLLKYEKEKDQAKILSLENENLEKDLSLRKRTNQRNIYLFSGLGIVAIILFLLIYYRLKARKDRIISDQRIIQLEEEKKLLAARSIVDGQEEERKRIAKELHDGLGVLLSTAKMQFTTIKDKSPENKILIDKATKLLEQAAGDVRKISHNMMPGLLTKFGLYEATEDLIEQIDETEGLGAKCEVVGDTERLPENTEIMLYRIVQELVNNTLKHADAKNIRLHMHREPNRLNIFYSDNGKGFDIAKKLESKSLGLNSIQSRINFLNGKVEIVSKPGEGVKYTIQIPI